MKRIFILLISFVCSLNVFSQSICLSEYEAMLLKKFNEMRLSKKLETVPLSKNLTIVAQTHANDLVLNYKPSDKCNMHSWSNKGKWSACCYTSDHKKASCMWNKPRELSNYTGNGYEIAFYISDTNLSPGEFADQALGTWLNSQGHKSVLLNEGIWKNTHWKAVGIGISNGYAVMWFGEYPDEETKPENCK